MIALYGGYANGRRKPPASAALLALVLIAVIYSVWRPSDLSADPENPPSANPTMLMMIIGMSLLYSYVMSYLHISQSAAEAIVAMHLPRWELLVAILLMVVVLGFFLPPGVDHHPDDGGQSSLPSACAPPISISSGSAWS